MDDATPPSRPAGPAGPGGPGGLPDPEPVRRTPAPAPDLPARPTAAPQATSHPVAPAPINVVAAGVGLARLTAGATLRLGRWGLGAGLRAGSRVIQAAVSGENATSLLDEAAAALRGQARDLLGIVDEAGRVVGFQMPEDSRAASVVGETSVQRNLRARGAALLDASSDVDYEEPIHPAYPRILDEMAPDEARIMRLLAAEGSQPSVDVRSSSPIPGGSQMIAPGLNMVAAEAGLRHIDKVQSYLNNLERLGLVWFSREPLEDPMAYQVLEAQPDVLEAMSHGRTKTVRRSIQITSFGQEFAEACILD